MTIDQDSMRYYLFDIGDVTAQILGACAANQPAGNRLSLTFLRPDAETGLPDEIMVKVVGATDAWESQQDWMELPLNVFQFDPPQARGDFIDRLDYLESFGMLWLQDAFVPQWYEATYAAYPDFRPYMDE